MLDENTGHRHCIFPLWPNVSADTVEAHPVFLYSTSYMLGWAMIVLIVPCF